MIDLMHLAPGTLLSLKNGSVAAIVDNLGDGIWLQLRFVRVTGGESVGDEELVHCEEIAGLADVD